jgi:hypothetical protein
MELAADLRYRINDIDRDRTKVTKRRLGIRHLGILFDMGH